MSPESQKPEPTQLDSKLQEGHHPTDMVWPFPQELETVHDELQKRGVPEVSEIDPVTLEVTVEKIPLEQTEDLQTTETDKKAAGWKKWVAGLVGGAVLAGGGYTAAKMGESNAASPDLPPANPNASAPVTPGETATDTPTMSETEAPVDTVSLDRISGTPTAEQIKAAMTEVVTTAEYPTVADAVVEMGNLLNVYAKSGSVSLVGDTFEFSPETKEQGTVMLENIYGPNLTAEKEAGHEEFRSNWSLAINNDPYPELMLYFEPDASTATDLGNGLWSIEANEMHDDSIPNNMNRGVDFRTRLTLQNTGDRWYMVSQELIHQIG